jgi:tetratricopeptide (TPR) repeat protein
MNRHSDALAQINAAISIRESMLAEDARDARRRSLLAGNYAERSTALQRMKRWSGAVVAAERAVELQDAVLALDPRGVPVRVSAADFHARAAAAYAGADNLPKAKDCYSRSLELYEDLRSEGHLKSSSIIADFEKAKSEAARLALVQSPALSK